MVPAQAERGAPKGLPIVRDAEIEQLLKEYTQPILKAAGLAQQNIQIIIINDRGFNAFVADGRRIFVNAGALIGCQDAERDHRRARARDPRTSPAATSPASASSWRRRRPSRSSP